MLDSVNDLDVSSSCLWHCPYIYLLQYKMSDMHTVWFLPILNPHGCQQHSNPAASEAGILPSCHGATGNLLDIKNIKPRLLPQIWKKILLTYVYLCSLDLSRVEQYGGSPWQQYN